MCLNRLCLCVRVLFHFHRSQTYFSSIKLVGQTFLPILRLKNICVSLCSNTTKKFRSARFAFCPHTQLHTHTHTREHTHTKASTKTKQIDYFHQQFHLYSFAAKLGHHEKAHQSFMAHPNSTWCFRAAIFRWLSYRTNHLTQPGQATNRSNHRPDQQMLAFSK